MTDLARSPRRIEHVRENSDKLFQDLFANCGIGSQKSFRDDSGYPRIPWKDRKLPPSFFQPPAPTELHDSQSQAINNQFSGISHAYSRSTPAINFAPSRSVFSRGQPAANLWGPSTLPNNSVPQAEYVTSDGMKEMHSLPVATTDAYNMQNNYAPYEQRPPYYQAPGAQSSMNYQSHINHGRQASLPYPHPRMASGNHRIGGSSLKQQQSKPSNEWWHQQQPSPQQYAPPNISVSNPSSGMGPACQHWSSTSTQNQWQQGQQDSVVAPDPTVFATPGPANRSLPPSSQNYPPNEWPSANSNSWSNNMAPPNVTAPEVPVVEQPHNSYQQPPQHLQQQGPPVIDDQRQELLYIAARLKDERDRMKAKIDELEKKLEDVMAALSLSTMNPSNGYYPSGGVSSANPDDLVPSLQIDQGNSLITPTHLENGNNSAGWM